MTENPSTQPLHAQSLIATDDSTTVGESLIRTFGGSWRASAGSVSVAGADVDVRAWPDGLRIDAYAGSEDALRAAERSVNDTLAQLHVDGAPWQTRPSTIPGAPPPVYPDYHFPHDDDHDD